MTHLQKSFMSDLEEEEARLDAIDQIVGGDQAALMTDPTGKPLPLADETLRAFLQAKLEKRKAQPAAQTQGDRLIEYLKASAAEAAVAARRRERKRDKMMALMAEAITGRSFNDLGSSPDSSSQEGPKKRKKSASGTPPLPL